jgi:signal transduction histidine kinase
MTYLQQESLNTFSINEEGDNNRRRWLLNIFLSGISVLALLILILAFVFRSEDQQGTQFVLTVTPPLLLVLVAIYILAKRNVQLGSILFVLLLIIANIFSDTPQQVMEGRSLFFMLAPVMIASFIIKPAASFAAASIASLALYWISVTENLTMNYIGAVGFFVFALVSWLAAYVYENALKELKSINKELDQRVAIRTQELADANQRLTELDRLKSKFVSDVSHELRTPIGNISMYLEMIEHGKPEKTKQYLEILKEDSRRLIKLVTNTLDLSRLETGHVEAEYTPINLNDICKKVTLSHNLRANAQGLTLHFSPSTEMPLTNGNSDQITQVAANLVSNAINYTSKGGVKLATFYDLDQNEVGFLVQDTGIGISPEDKKHLFERFYRGDRVSQSSIPGTGLGLAICQEIVSHHNGRIEVQSEENVGSVFKVFLPIQ